MLTDNGTLYYGNFQGDEDCAMGPPHRQLMKHFNISAEEVVLGGAVKADDDKPRHKWISWVSGQCNLGAERKTELNDKLTGRMPGAEKGSKPFRDAGHVGQSPVVFALDDAIIDGVLDHVLEESKGHFSLEDEHHGQSLQDSLASMKEYADRLRKGADRALGK